MVAKLNWRKESNKHEKGSIDKPQTPQTKCTKGIFFIIFDKDFLWFWMFTNKIIYFPIQEFICFPNSIENMISQFLRMITQHVHWLVKQAKCLWEALEAIWLVIVRAVEQCNDSWNRYGILLTLFSRDWVTLRRTFIIHGHW